MIINAFLKFYITIANALASVSSRMPAGMRTALLYLSSFVILWNGTLRFCNIYIREALFYYDTSAIVGIVMIAIFTFFSVDRKVETEQLEINRFFWTGWILCFGMMLIMSFFNEVREEYLLWGVVSLLFFPLIYVSHEHNSERICSILAQNTELIALVFFISSIIVDAMMTEDDLLLFEEYTGIASNPNNNGMVCTAFFGAAFYMLFTDRKRRFTHLIVIGISAALSVVSLSRTSVLAILIQCVVGLWFYLKWKKKSNFCRFTSKNAIACVLIVLVVAVASGMLFKASDDFSLAVHAESARVEIQETKSTGVYDWLNYYSSRRMDVWSAYLKETRFFGNGSPKELLIEGYDASRWAHNNALDILYASGVIPFAGYVMFLLSGLAFILKSLCKETDNKREALFCIIMFAGYFCQAMLEITITPISAGIVFLTYAGLAPMAMSGRKRKGERPIHSSIADHLS